MVEDDAAEAHAKHEGCQQERGNQRDWAYIEETDKYEKNDKIRPIGGRRMLIMPYLISSLSMDVLMMEEDSLTDL